MMNNPGNLRPVGSSSGFQQFDTPDAGLDAMRNDLLAKISGNSPAMKAKFGEGYQPTLSTLISTYAPSSENDTANYINVVSRDTGLDPNQPLSPADVDKIIPSMVKMESGPAVAKQLTGSAGNDSAAPASASNTFNVKLPDGTTINGIPVGTTKDQIRAKFEPKGFKFDAAPKLTDTIAQQQIPQMGDALKDAATSDVGKSAISGVPEGLMAATPLGMGANAASFGENAAKFVGQQGFNLAEKIMGDKKSYVFPPSDTVIPNSNDILAGALKPTGIELHEPQTRAGKLAKAVTSSGSFGKATGIPLSGTIPSAVVSEAAGQAAEDTPYEVPARIAGQIIGLVGANALRDKALAPKATTPTANDIKDLARQSYKAADNAGGIVLPKTFSDIVDKVKTGTEYQSAEGRLFSGENEITKTLSDLEKLKDKPLSLLGAQEIDEELSNRIDSHFDKINGYDKVGTKLLGIQRSLRDAYENISPNDVVGGKDGFDAWKQGQQLWSAARHADDIERILAKGESADVPSTVYKNGFKALAKSGMRGFTDEERAAIQHAAKTGIITGALKTIGSRLMSGVAGTAAGAIGGGPVGAVGGLVAGEAAGYPLRAAANALQRGRGEAVLEEIGNRPAVQSALSANTPTPTLQMSSNAKLIQNIRTRQMPPITRRLSTIIRP